MIGYKKDKKYIKNNFPADCSWGKLKDEKKTNA